MKVCVSCGFQNPDNYVSCLHCGGGLQLTAAQAQEIREKQSKITDSSRHDEDEQLLNSWQIAQEHRFDWLWEIGGKINKFRRNLISIFIIILIICAAIFLGLMFSSLGKRFTIDQII